MRKFELFCGRGNYRIGGGHCGQGVNVAQLPVFVVIGLLLAGHAAVVPALFCRVCAPRAAAEAVSPHRGAGFIHPGKQPVVQTVADFCVFFPFDQVFHLLRVLFQIVQLVRGQQIDRQLTAPVENTAQRLEAAEIIQNRRDDVNMGNGMGIDALYEAFRKEGLAISTYFSKPNRHCNDYWRRDNPGLIVCDRFAGEIYENIVTPEKTVPETALPRWLKITTDRAVTSVTAMRTGEQMKFVPAKGCVFVDTEGFEWKDGFYAEGFELEGEN